MDPSIASSIWLVGTIASLHADPSGMRQYNPGVGVEYARWHAGEYLNSFDRRTWYVAREWSGGERYKLGIMLGAGTGYNPIAGMHLRPMPIPFIAYEGKHFGANLLLMPDPLQWNQSLLALQLKGRF